MGNESSKRPFVSLSSDFGSGNRGASVMHAVIYKICPEAKILDLSHSIPGFDIRSGARILEGSYYLPKGIHVCVVDPGVGTSRKAIIIETVRGDFLIGPDNGVLIPAARDFLGGIEKAVEITNEDYMQKPVSHIFHGRDVFASAAGWLAKGIPIEQFGPELSVQELVQSPYENACIEGNKIEAEIIDINNFGTIFLNIKKETMESFAVYKDKIKVNFLSNNTDNETVLLYLKTFGEVPEGKPLLLNDDFGRVELALNQGNFSEKFNVKRGEKILLSK